MDIIPLLFSVMNWGEFGQARYTETVPANEKLRIPISIPAGRWWLVFRYRFGDITANNLNFRFDGVRNYFEQNIMIGNELINFTTWCCPYIGISGQDAAIVVENTAATTQTFEMVLDFVVIDDEIAGRIREFLYKKREEFREEVTSQQGTGGA